MLIDVKQPAAGDPSGAFGWSVFDFFSSLDNGLVHLGGGRHPDP